VITIALFGLVFATYFDCLGYGFVNLDDPVMVTNNPALLSKDLATLLFKSVPSLFHPVTSLTFYLNYLVGGLDPFGYHLVNVIIHGLNAVLTFVFLFQILGHRALWTAAAVAAIFAIHPSHVEAVVWITARKDVMCTFFILLSLIANHYRVRADRTSRWRLETAVFATFVCAALSKPYGVIVPALVLSMDALVYKKSWRQSAIRQIPYMIISAGLVAYNISIHRDPQALPVERLDNPLLLATKGFCFYTAASLFPRNLHVWYDHDTFRLPAFYIAVCTVLWPAIAAGMIRLKTRRNILLFFSLFFVITIGPILKIIHFGGDFIVADRFTYLPSTAIWVLLAVVIGAAGPMSKTKAGALIVLFAVTSGIYVTMTVAQIRVWGSSELLWRNAILQSPETPYPYIALGNLQLKEGEFELARQSFAGALEVWPDHDEAYRGLALAAKEQGNLSEALEMIGRALAVNPKETSNHFRCGEIYWLRGNLDRAKYHFERWTLLSPGSADAYYNLGSVLIEMKQLVEAQEQLEKAISLHPEHAKANNNLGIVMQRQGRHDRAIPYFMRKIELEPDDPVGWANLGESQIETGNTVAGKENVRKALSMGLDPTQFWSELLER
jgi:tetratricopeptide (TPR) repeat protein